MQTATEEAAPPTCALDGCEREAQQVTHGLTGKLTRRRWCSSHKAPAQRERWTRVQAEKARAAEEAAAAAAPPPIPLTDLTDREARLQTLTERLDEEEADLDERAAQLRRRADIVADANNEIEDRVTRARVRRVLAARLTNESAAELLTPGEMAALANALRGYLRPLEGGTAEPDVDTLAAEIEEANSIEWVGDEEETDTLAAAG